MKTHMIGPQQTRASERALISTAADSQAHPLSVFKVETIQGAKRR